MPRGIDDAATATSQAAARHPVPRIVHQIWLQGAASIPSHLLEYLQANLEFCHAHGWAHILWDDVSIRALLEATNPRWLELYDRLPHVHQRVDLGRYAVLYVLGGISVDMDAKVLRDPYSALRMQEAPGSSSDGVTYASYGRVTPLQARAGTWGHYDVLVNNAIIITSPRRAVMHRLIDSVRADADIGLLKWAPAAVRKAAEVAGSTGPAFFTAFMLAAQTSGEVTVLEADVLEPCDISGCAVSQRTLVVHNHNLSWLPQGAVKFVRGMYAGGADRMRALALGACLLGVAIAAAALVRQRKLASAVTRAEVNALR